MQPTKKTAKKSKRIESEMFWRECIQESQQKFIFSLRCRYNFHEILIITWQNFCSILRFSRVSLYILFHQSLPKPERQVVKPVKNQTLNQER